MKALARTN